MENSESRFKGWAILGLMGHRRLGGIVEETTLAGAGVLRIDIPAAEEGKTYATQYYPPSSVYCLTPCSEEAAKAAARLNRPAPVAQWELPSRPELAAKYDPQDPQDYHDDERAER